jgi:hypothetical protein
MHSRGKLRPVDGKRKWVNVRSVVVRGGSGGLEWAPRPCAHTPPQIVDARACSTSSCPEPWERGVLIRGREAEEAEEPKLEERERAEALGRESKQRLQARARLKRRVVDIRPGVIWVVQGELGGRGRREPAMRIEHAREPVRVRRGRAVRRKLIQGAQHSGNCAVVLRARPGLARRGARERRACAHLRAPVVLRSVEPKRTGGVIKVVQKELAPEVLVRRTVHERAAGAGGARERGCSRSARAAIRHRDSAGVPTSTGSQRARMCSRTSDGSGGPLPPVVCTVGASIVVADDEQRLRVGRRPSPLPCGTISLT